MKRSQVIQIISDAIVNYEIEKSLNTRLTIEQASEQLLKELEDLGMAPPRNPNLNYEGKAYLDDNNTVKVIIEKDTRGWEEE